LGQGSFLTMTSVATRTSPVTRGKWILDNLLGLPPPNPPPNVPSIEASASTAPQTLRQQMLRHRGDPVCAACHTVMDPFGFALENFDAVGRWRATDGGLPIDAADALFDGTEVDGPAGLRAFLLANRELFLQTATEKLMTYALGRTLTPADQPAVRKILRNAASRDYRFSSLVLGIAQSDPFLLRATAAEPAATLSAAGR
jgi:hypothetical protein